MQLKLPADVQLVLLFGEISARKGVLSLLEAAADPACSPHVHVMLAGRFTERRQLLENAAFRRLNADGRLHAIDGYVSGEQERQVLSAADCTWLGYTGSYGMSGVMVLSGRHGVPVLASREGLIGYFAKKHEIGMIIEPRNRASVVNALKGNAELPLESDTSTITTRAGLPVGERTRFFSTGWQELYGCI